MPGNPAITLTTDFGYHDPFAGVMKGTILSINPDARIIDLTHGIMPQDIREAAFIIGMNYRYFPAGTIHVVVVDPGVGSSRRALLVEAGRHYFIGPDNGVFSYIFGVLGGAIQVVHITAAKYYLSSESSTFQGRDLFAPVAAWLSRGIEPSQFGEAITDYEKIGLPKPMKVPDGIEGEVILVDSFGNAITNVTKQEIEKIISAGSGRPPRILIHKGEVQLKKFYSESAPGELSAVINSSGYLEFFINRGNASSEYKIAVSDKVRVFLKRNQRRP